VDMRLLRSSNSLSASFRAIPKALLCVDSPIEKNIRATMLGVEREGPAEIVKRCTLKIGSSSGLECFRLPRIHTI